jgi:hypothetical protein
MFSASSNSEPAQAVMNAASSMSDNVSGDGVAQQPRVLRAVEGVPEHLRAKVARRFCRWCMIERDRVAIVGIEPRPRRFGEACRRHIEPVAGNDIQRGNDRAAAAPNGDTRLRFEPERFAGVRIAMRVDDGLVIGVDTRAADDEAFGLCRESRVAQGAHGFLVRIEARIVGRGVLSGWSFLPAPVRLTQVN